MKFIDQQKLVGKRVLLRADLNVPMHGKKIIDSSRIKRLLPTIDLLKKKEAKIIMLSHFGRPEGRAEEAFSLSFMQEILSSTYDTPVKFCHDILSSDAVAKTHDLGNAEIMLLENVRFYKEEEENNIGFAKKLSTLGDIYVNDAFSCSHRAHASIDQITRFLPSYPGLLLLEEVRNLERVLSGSERPRLAIVAGKKVSTKFPILHNLIHKVDYLFIAGAMANTFYKALGKEVGNSYIEGEVLSEVQSFYAKNKAKLLLPIDFVVAEKTTTGFINQNMKDLEAIGQNDCILDIGVRSCEDLEQTLKKMRAVLWNGPLGMYEDKRFSSGTDAIAKSVSALTRENKIVSVAGGGDIVAALEASGAINHFTYISTAGGAFLEWLEGKELPGIRALKQQQENI